MRGSVAPCCSPFGANWGPPTILNRWSISDVNEEREDRRLRGEDAPLLASPRCDWRRGRGVVPPVFGVNKALLVRIDGVCGRFLYAEAGIVGGPIAPGLNGGMIFAAAAMTSLWSDGSGGGEAPRDRELPELPGRRGVLIASLA